MALEGPGIVLQLEDSQVPVAPGGSVGDYRVAARDLRPVVEELWLAGAEAIVRERRAGRRRRRPSSTSAASLLVNSAYLAPPYQVAAIGPADLYDRVSRPRPGSSSSSASGSSRAGSASPSPSTARSGVPAFAGSVTLSAGAPLVSPAPTPVSLAPSGSVQP